MTDVAREAGVSVTVSYVFSRPQRVSPDVRELVVQAARRLNYHGPDPAARSLARGRSNSVGVIVGEGLTYAFDDSQSTRSLVGVTAVCVEYQQNMVLIPRRRRHRRRLARQGGGGRLLHPLDRRARRPGPRRSHRHRQARRHPGSAARLCPAGPSQAANPADRRIRVIAADDRSAASAVTSATFADARAPAVVSFALRPESSPAGTPKRYLPSRASS